MLLWCGSLNNTLLLLGMFKSPNGLLCADVPLRNYSLTYSLTHCITHQTNTLCIACRQPAA